MSKEILRPQNKPAQQEPLEDLATELFVVAQISPADDGFSETIERIESWLRGHFTTPPVAQRQWVDLTSKDLNEIFAVASSGEGAVLLAAKIIKEKNT